MPALKWIGFSLVPLRIFCRPELSLFTLQRAGAAVPGRGPGQRGDAVL